VIWITAATSALSSHQTQHSAQFDNCIVRALGRTIHTALCTICFIHYPLQKFNTLTYTNVWIS